MADTLDQLEEIARAAIEYGDVIGEQRWFRPGELQALANRGARGMVAVSAQDDAHLAAFSPATARKLLAVARAAQQVNEDATTYMAALPAGVFAGLSALRAALEELEKQG